MIGIIGRWRFFKKLGYKGWVSIIPFYNVFCIFEALYGNGWRMFQPVLVIPGIMILCISIGYLNIKNLLAFMIICFLLCTSYYIYFIMSYVIRLTHSFNKDGWWTVGTLFLYPVMVVVYGISDVLFKGRAYPYPAGYDAIDGFIDYFRRQLFAHKQDIDVNEVVCKKCGAPLRKNATFCSTCGTKVS